jgi:hypothetical protein
MATALHNKAFLSVSPHFSIFQDNRVYLPADATHLGKKLQNQQNSAREQPALSIQRIEEEGYDSWSNAAP